MTHRSRKTSPARRPLWNPLAIACLGLGLACAAGCNSSDTAATGERPPADARQAADARQTADVSEPAGAKDSAERQPPEGTVTEEYELPRAKIAARSEPNTFKLTPLWKCTDLKLPGSILVVEQADGPPRILVIDAFKSVVEVGPEGKVIADHPLGIDQTEIVNALRTAVGADGTRYFAAFALLFRQQRFHLLDENLELLHSYPQDALENPHQGIADVQLGDLDGDGTVEAYVGFWGVVGVQTVSLHGTRLWSNRSLAQVSHIAIGRPDPQKPGRLFCTNNTGSLATIDADGKPQGRVALPGQFLQSIAAADLSGDGRPEWCGMVFQRPGENVAIGLDRQGTELWNYTLPTGVHPHPIERIIPGRLTPSPPGQWLLPGPDGSIHLIAADGQPLDRFNHGATLYGLATAELDGRPVLIVSSPNGLEAWEVE